MMVVRYEDLHLNTSGVLLQMVIDLFLDHWNECVRFLLPSAVKCRESLQADFIGVKTSSQQVHTCRP